MQQPSWLAEAWAEFGQREISGRRHNTRITAYFEELGHWAHARDEVPWCAAYLGACLERSGIQSTRSLMARSYLRWGEEIKDARFGAVAVLSRGRDPAAGHVGFWLGDSGDRLWLLGGNQGRGVSVAGFARSRLLGLRWPAALIDTGAVLAAAEGIFDDALRHVLKMEGGFTDDPVDPGGPTNKGITLRVLAAWRKETLSPATLGRLLADLKRIRGDEVRSIYRERYWWLGKCAEMAPGLAFMHFDAAVNHGVTGAARLLQSAVGADVDGVIGPQTRGAIMRLPVIEVLKRYAAARREKYRSLPHFWRFGRGWLRRVDETLEAAGRIVERSKGGGQTANGNERGVARVDERNDTGTGDRRERGAKWWGESLTIWGALITAASTVLPIFGKVVGLDITPELVRDVGEDVVTALQLLGGVIGTLMALYGRARASQPLERRPMKVML